MLKRFALVFAVAAFASPALAQENVGTEHYSGIPWSVAAPEGASWTMSCRFSPVTMEMSRYNRNQMVNQLQRQGSGPDRGRLPGDNGSCTLTKTGGAGPVGIAVVKEGVATSRGTNAAQAPVVVNVF